MSDLEVDADKQFILPYIKAVAVDLNDSEIQEVVKKCKRRIIRDISSVSYKDYHNKFYAKIMSFHDGKRTRSKKLCITIK